MPTGTALASVLVFPAVITTSSLTGALMGSLVLDVNVLSVCVGPLPPAPILAAIRNIFEEPAWRGCPAPMAYALKGIRGSLLVQKA